ncbi:MAG: hypoxanthine phosphoribosyltransferase [Acidobacteriota bacterium]|jgi:hypoxanthine phosphoribosyltransferase
MRLSREVLFSQRAIGERVAAMGEQISRDYADQRPAVLAVLKGSFVFMADLVRQIRRPVRCGFIEIASSRRSASLTEMVFTSSFEVEGADILLVEDILDTGITMAYLRQQLELREPRSIRVAALLDKPVRRKVQIEADYVGFEVPDRYVVGYGLDYGEDYRNLPYLSYVE